MGIFATMESADLMQSEAGDIAAEQLGVVTETNDIVEATQEVAGQATEVEEAVDTGEELAALGDIAEKAIESGEGLSEDAAAAVLVATESALFRLGMSRKEIKRRLPSMESFGNTNTRMASTVASLETVMETIKKVWTYVKDLAARIWEKIRSLFARLFSSADGLEKSLKAVKERAAKMKSGTEPGKKEIESSLAKKFEIAKKADYSTLVTVLENSKALASAINAYAKARLEDVTAVARRISQGTNEEIGSRVVDFDKGLPAIDKKFSGTGWSELECSGPFGNGIILTVGKKSSADDDSSAAEAIDSIGVKFEKMKDLEAKSFQTLTLDQIKNTADVGIGLLTKFRELKNAEATEAKTAKALKDLAENVIKSMERAAKDKDGNVDKEIAKRARTARFQVGVLINVGNVVVGQGPSVVFGAASVAYQVAAASMAQYKSKED